MNCFSPRYLSMNSSKIFKFNSVQRLAANRAPIIISKAEAIWPPPVLSSNKPLSKDKLLIGSNIVL